LRDADADAAGDDDRHGSENDALLPVTAPSEDQDHDQPDNMGEASGTPPQNSPKPAVVVSAESALLCSVCASNWAEPHQNQATAAVGKPTAAVFQKDARERRRTGVSSAAVCWSAIDDIASQLPALPVTPRLTRTTGITLTCHRMSAPLMSNASHQVRQTASGHASQREPTNTDMTKAPSGSVS
jgi:hypothetical protein